MDMISSMFLFFFIIIGFYYVKNKTDIKKYKDNVKKEDISIKNTDENMINNNRIELDTLDKDKLTVPEIAHPTKSSSLKQEAEKIDKQIMLIKLSVLTIVNNSLFFEPMANWRGETVYKFMLYNNDVFEFEDFLTENENMIGINNEKICFKRLCYKKLNNNIEKLLENFKQLKGQKVVLKEI